VNFFLSTTGFCVAIPEGPEAVLLYPLPVWNCVA